MKRFSALLLAGALTMLFSGGCTHEVAHTDETHHDLLGGTTNTDTRVYQNPDGTTSVDQTKTHTNP